MKKPLSEKTIAKMFSSWDTAIVEKLHRYLEAFSELYGVIMVKDAWDVLRHYEPEMHRKDFMAFVDIAMREEAPYYILEIDELYCEEKAKPANRLIINKKLVGRGYGKYRDVYDVVDLQYGKDVYLPDDIFGVRIFPTEWNNLYTLLRNLKNTKGGKLDKLTFLNHYERFQLEYYKDSKRKEAVLQSSEIPAAKKITEELKQYSRVGNAKFQITYLSDICDELDVVITENLLEKVINLLQTAHNNTHSWANNGWTPFALAGKYSIASKSVSFGPNMQKYFADGTMNKAEIEAFLKSQGIDVID